MGKILEFFLTEVQKSNVTEKQPFNRAWMAAGKKRTKGCLIKKKIKFLLSQLLHNKDTQQANSDLVYNA